MKVNIKMELKMDMVYIHLNLVIFIKDNGLMVNYKDKVNINGVMVLNILGNG